MLISSNRNADSQVLAFASVSPVVEKFKADDSLELTVRLPKDVVQKLDRIKELYSHMVPDGNWVQVIDQMADDVLAKRDPLKKKTGDVQKTVARAPMRKETGLAETLISDVTLDLCSKNQTQGNTDTEVKSAEARFLRRKPLRESARRFIFQRDRCCQFRHPNGSICGSRYQLEVDHIQPHFAGGSDQVENLRALCRLHNQHRYRT